MEGVGTFPVERGRGDSSAVTRALALLSQGRIVGIFPQGTCMPLRQRPLIARRPGSRSRPVRPIVLVALVGTERILRPHRFKVGLPKVRVLVAAPIEVEPQTRPWPRGRP